MEIKDLNEIGTTAIKNEILMNLFDEFEKYKELNHTKFSLLLHDMTTETIALAFSGKLIDLIHQADESKSAPTIRTIRTAYEKIYKTINKLEVEK
ncbi:hypothetical protein KAU09_04370 [Candidatus Parcubacteria bacterium]|nr:hypothetical protein [Candidatus Parcubacteria bacterium]